MNDNEIQDAIDNPDKLVRLTDEFRMGRPLADLLGLLNQPSNQVRQIGAFIANEVALHGEGLELVVARLHQLTEDSDEMVRYYSIGALYPFLRDGTFNGKEVLDKLAQDPNPGVRARAKAAICRQVQ